MNLPPWRRDIGCFDDDRYLYYKDRKKDMIVRGGFNIYPAEVESVLYEPPSVQQCAIIGKPHKKLGEDLLAYVITKKDKTVASKSFPGFALSLNSAGKTDKVRLRIG